jgi:hypothetical protein
MTDDRNRGWRIEDGGSRMEDRDPRSSDGQFRKAAFDPDMAEAGGESILVRT